MHLYLENFNFQKQRLLDNTERLERSSRVLDGGYKLAVESGEILFIFHSLKNALKNKGLYFISNAL